MTETSNNSGIAKKVTTLIAAATIISSGGLVGCDKKPNQPKAVIDLKIGETMPNEEQLLQEQRKTIDTGTLMFDKWALNAIEKNEPFKQVDMKTVSIAELGTLLSHDGDIAILKGDVTIKGKVGIGILDTKTGKCYKMDELTELLGVDDYTPDRAILRYTTNPNRETNPDAQFVPMIYRDSVNNVMCDVLDHQSTIAQVAGNYYGGKKTIFTDIDFRSFGYKDFGYNVDTINSYFLDINNPDKVKVRTSDIGVTEDGMQKMGATLLHELKSNLHPANNIPQYGHLNK